MDRARSLQGWLLATLVAWTLFTFVLWIATFRHNKALVAVFSTLLMLFILLDIHVWTGSKLMGTIAGWEGMFCALTAWYLMAAIVINDSYGREVLPVGSLEKEEHPAERAMAHEPDTKARLKPPSSQETAARVGNTSPY